MKYFTFVLNSDEVIKIKDTYSQLSIPDNNEYVLGHYQRNQVELILYKTGKLLLRGESLNSEISFIKKILNRNDYAAIGSDEVGTGDVFGPVVVCAAYTTIEDIAFLESLNIRDTKSVNDEFIIKNGPIIAKRLTHSIIILEPEKYNNLVKLGYNMNKIKAHLHNQAIVSLDAKLNTKVPVIVDQFCPESQYYNYLKDETLVFTDINFSTKAENLHIAVAAAAVIARYGFLYSMNKLSKEIGLRLAKGASKIVDKQLEYIVQQKGKKTLPKIAKINFKNVSKLIG